MKKKSTRRIISKETLTEGKHHVEAPSEVLPIKASLSYDRVCKVSYPKLRISELVVPNEVKSEVYGQWLRSYLLYRHV